MKYCRDRPHHVLMRTVMTIFGLEKPSRIQSSVEAWKISILRAIQMMEAGLWSFRGKNEKSLKDSIKAIWHFVLRRHVSGSWAEPDLKASSLRTTFHSTKRHHKTSQGGMSWTVLPSYLKPWEAQEPARHNNPNGVRAACNLGGDQQLSNWT